MDPENPITTLPIEIMTKIFSFLPRRERFICMCLCPRWREALDVPYLWKHVSVRLDVDFFEVSTLQLTMEFCNHIKSLELCFEHFDEPMQWMHYRILDITKRTYRFVSVFLNRNLQLQNVMITNFCVFYRTKKILYYLSLFLRSQHHLLAISFNGSFFNKKTFIRLLNSAISMNHTNIKELDMQNSYYENDYYGNNADHGGTRQMIILSNRLMNSVTHIESLRVLKIDLECLISNNILKAFLRCPCKSLELLDVRISEHDLRIVTNPKMYTNNVWLNLLRRYPLLKVAMTFHNVIHVHDTWELILCRSIPLNSFAWITTSFMPKTLVEQCVKKYRNILERIKLNSNKTYLNELLIFVIKKCPNLACLEFSGLISNVSNLQSILLKANFQGFKNYEFYVRARRQKREFFLHNEKLLKVTALKPA